MIDFRNSQGLVPLRGRRRVAMGVVSLVLLGAVVGMARLADASPEPLPASAPASMFSADRAWGHLEQIVGDAPTPVGSAGGDAIRDYLVEQLALLGLEVEIQEGVGAHTFGGRVETVAGRVENVIATLPGRDSTGRVLLVAHYDTTHGSPGAADDKAAVAAILETARAITSGPQLRNDLVILLTDGEEPGMLGAAAFVDQHRFAADGGLVLNWEGAGNVGRSTLFETSPDNAALIEIYAQVAPHPIDEAAMATLYQVAPNNTDFTVLGPAGFAGLNFGMIDGRAHYHSMQDTLANLDPGSVQDQGESMLALATAFGERDLGTAIAAEADAVYFSAFGVMISYPASLVWPLAVLALAAVVAFAVAARRRGLVRLPAVLWGVVAALGLLIAAPLAAIAMWEVVLLVRPAYAGMLDPYQPWLYRVALVAVAASVLLGWYLLVRRRIDDVALAVGALMTLALIGLLTAWLVPGLSYYGSIAAGSAATGALVALAVPERRPFVRLAMLTAGAAPGVLILGIGAMAVMAVIGIPMGAAAVLFLALAGLVVLPLVELATSVEPGHAPTFRRFGLVSLGGFAVVSALTAGGLAVDRFDADHPAPAHLAYVLDADRGMASFVSEDTTPDAWGIGHAADRSPDVMDLPLPYRDGPAWHGSADVISAPAPELTVFGRRVVGEALLLDLEIVSVRDADFLTLHVDRPVAEATISVAGQAAVTARPSYAESPDDEEWPYELRFYDPPREGVRVTLELYGTDAPRFALSDSTFGLHDIPGFVERPSGVGQSTDHGSDLVTVVRRYEP
jgi:hypothetical protein